MPLALSPHLVLSLECLIGGPLLPEAASIEVLSGHRPAMFPKTNFAPELMPRTGWLTGPHLDFVVNVDQEDGRL